MDQQRSMGGNKGGGVKKEQDHKITQWKKVLIFSEQEKMGGCRKFQG